MSDCIDIKLLDSNDGTKFSVSRWLKKPGDSVKKDEAVLEVNTDKVSVEVASPCDGIIEKILVEADQAFKPRDILGTIRPSHLRQAPVTQLELSSPPSGNPDINQSTDERLSPAVKKMLAEHNISPDQITGSGYGGRVSVKDVENYLSRLQSNPLKSVIKPISTMRQTIARHMHQSLSSAPHVTTVFEADLSKVQAHRESWKPSAGRRPTFTPYFIWAIAQAVKEVPEANSRFLGDKLEVYEDCNVGVAIALAAGMDSGLLVPVIKNVERLTLEQISLALNEFTSKAKENLITKQDMEHGTITISNYGAAGGLFAAPIIINQPQSAIVGVGKIEKRQKVATCLIDGVEKDSMVILPMSYVSLTIDHRVLDGFRASLFMQKFCEALSSFKA